MFFEFLILYQVIPSSVAASIRALETVASKLYVTGAAAVPAEPGDKAVIFENKD